MVHCRSAIVSALAVLPLGSTLPNYQGCATEKSKEFAYCNASMSIAERVSSLVNSMTLEEKVSRIYGCVEQCDTCPCAVERFDLPPYAYLLEVNTAVAAVCLQEERCATVFVGPNGLAASFNRTAWHLKGQVISTEVRAFHNHGGKRGLGKPTGVVAFGPNINIVRDPRFGRNSELVGEDPFLAGSYGVEYTKGMQEKDEAGYPRMISYLKHFTAYSRETDRGSDDYAISDYDFEDTFLPQYEMGMKDGQAGGVMCSYNAENGHPSCANNWLLNEVLRKRWGRPDAVVTSDGGAVRNLMNPPVRAATLELAAAMAINNGTDINDGQAFQALPAAIAQNLTTEAHVDEALTRSLKQLFQVGLFDPVEQVSWTSVPLEAINSTAHQRANYDSALQSMVLLKNEGLLPLEPGQRIAVVGPHAEGRLSLLSDYASEEPCFNGTDACIVSIADAVRAINGPELTLAASGVEIDSDDASGVAAALALVARSDVVVLALGTDRGVEGEGHDRPHSRLPGIQAAFAERVLELGKPTLLVLVNGGALAIDDLVSAPRAIVEAFNPGTVGAGALAEQIFGRQNRWGKLPITVYPSSFDEAQDLASFDMTAPPGRTYRYYTGTPLWPFGFGLSLTRFALQCGGRGLSFTCEVSNLGGLDGDEVVLVFHRPSREVREQADHVLPAKRLIGFERRHVRAGGAVTVEFEIQERMLELVVGNGSKVLFPGRHDIVFWRGNGDEQVLPVTLGAPLVV